MAKAPHFGREDVRRYYDRAGSFQDKQSFYEDVALDALVRHGDFAAAQSVFEFGCGTGRFAERLLADVLPPTARYVGIDISSTMLELARGRLARWAGRAEVRESVAGFDFSDLGGPFDRIVATYVFDLLSEEDIAAALAGCRATVKPGGLLCTAGLTRGTTAMSRLTSSAWSWIHARKPSLVGGCRPLELCDHLPKTDWRVIHREVVVGATVPSEVIVAEAI